MLQTGSRARQLIVAVSHSIKRDLTSELPPKTRLIPDWRLLVLLGGTFVLKAVVLAQLKDHPLLAPESGLDTTAVEKVLRPQKARVDRDAAWAAIARDKKAVNGTPRLVLLEAPGKPVTGVELPEERVREALDELIAE